MKADFRTYKEINKDRTKTWLLRILILTALIVIPLLFSGCAHSGAALSDKANDFGEDFTENTFDKAEDVGGFVLGNLLKKAVKGGKKIYVDNPGCVAVKITRFDGGEISGSKSVIIPPEQGVELLIKLGVLTSSRDNLILQAERYGDIPPGCRRIGRDTEGFRMNYEPEGWRVRLR